MDYFALFLCAGCVVLSGIVLNVESCLEKSRECIRLSKFQSIDDDQMPGNCKNLTKAKSCFDMALRECKSTEYHRMISTARDSTENQYNTYCFFSVSNACLQEGSQCARVMQTGEMRMDQLDQLCPKLSSALSCLNAAIATCTSDAERNNLNSGKMGLEQQFNTLCSGGCSIADIMKCSPKNMNQPPALNEETCQAARQMKVCIADVRTKCTQEDIKAQIDMQIQFADQMLTQCASITSGSGGCSISDIMNCSPKNMDQLSTVNEETCKAVRQMKVCIADVRAKCTQEDIKAQIDMQIQGLEQMLPQCPNTTSEPSKKKKVKIPKIKKIKKTKKIKNLKKEKEDRKKKKKQRRPRFLL